jgi:hypothetical protein
MIPTKPAMAAPMIEYSRAKPAASGIVIWRVR